MTRRSMLAGAAGALLAPDLARAVPAFARTAPPLGRPGAGRGHAAPAGRIERRWVGRLSSSPRTFAVPKGFRTVGVGWESPRTPHLELRARQPGGGWGAWVPAGSAGHGPGRFGEPLWLGDAGEVELRAEGVVSGVALHYVTSARRLDAVSAAFPLAQPVLDAAAGQPPIIARTAWAGRGSPPRFAPELGTVKLAFVHHTESPSGYSAQEVPSLLENIYTFHRNVRGWNDIGYNFVIDLYGRAWEAREGGIDLAVVGAQAGGYNAVSTGVAILGSFTDSPPSRAAMQTLERLLAWKLSLHGVPVKGHVTVRVDPAAAFYTPFRPGQRVSLPRIAGHRDGDSTDCPGDALYARLGSVRTAARRLVGANQAALTLQAPGATVTAGDALDFSGLLSAQDGSGISGAPVILQSLGGAHRVDLKEVLTGASGDWAVTLVAAQNLIVRALRTGPPAAVSDVAFVEVAPRVSLAQQSSHPLVLAGVVDPPKPSVMVRLRAGGRVVETHRVRVSHGRFSLKVTRRGRFTAVASTEADALNAAGASPPLEVSG